MALTLAADIDAAQTAITLSGTLPAALAYGYEFRIGDELFVFERFEPKRLRVAGTWVDIPFAKVPSQLAWQVRRGEGGSTAASHSSGAGLVGVNEASVSGGTTAKPIPWPSDDGGAVDSVNGQTGVVELTLAQTLTAGNDTGGLGIVNTPAVDTAADTSLTATATGTGPANALIAAIAANADAVARTSANASGSGSAYSYPNASATGGGSAFAGPTATAQGGGEANVLSTATSEDGEANASSAANVLGSGDAIATTRALISVAGEADIRRLAQTADGNALAGTRALASGSGGADVTTEASAAGGSASFGPVADATRADIQCNGATLYSGASAAPTTFTTLFYRDTTAVTGRMYMWDFITAAYVAISGVF